MTRLESAEALARCSFNVRKRNGLLHVELELLPDCEPHEVSLIGPQAAAATIGWCAASLATWVAVATGDRALCEQLLAIVDRMNRIASHKPPQN